ncbi:hypothetical protein [Sulfurimonas sp.]|uniref:hypothetical protein n=1 Tax=Sulfurimonas sp. TaxID=2022749 RepID=UPI003D12A25B
MSAFEGFEKGISTAFTIFLDPVNISLFIANILIYVFASSIIKKLFNSDTDNSVTNSKVRVFKFFAIVLFLLHFAEILFVAFGDNSHNGVFLKSAFSIVIAYVSIFAYHIGSHIIIKEFGDDEGKDEDGNVIKTTSYKSRIFNLILGISIGFFILVSIVNLWHVESVLGTTGVIGIFIGFMALTSGIWGQDLYNGLILLHSKLISEGYIIRFDNVFYLVYKTTPVETILFDIYNNTRTVIRNKELGNKIIENITRVSHLQGYRIAIEYKVGYNIDYTLESEARLEQMKENHAKIQSALEDTYEEALESKEIAINEKYPPELFLHETGDHALHYTVSFYLEMIDKTNSTLVARRYLKSKDLFNELFFKNSIKYGFDLSTPITYLKV